MRRVTWPIIFVVLLTACGDDADDETEITPAPEEIAIGEDGEEIVTTTTLPPDDSEDDALEEDDEDPLRIATLLPIESGTHEGEHWFKWKLDEPVPDPAEQYIRTYQLNIRSLEDDIFGVGYTLTQDEEPFAAGFCLEDRPNCADPAFPVDVAVDPAKDELILRVPEGTFGNATGLDMTGFLIDFLTPESDPLNTDLGSAPASLEEKDPC